MGNQVTLFESSALPDYIRARGVDAVTRAIAGNIVSGNKRISIRGRRFRMIVGGEEVGVSDQNTLQVVVVNAAKDISREFYGTLYDPKKEASAPDCWSANGLAPDPSVENPVHKNCADCPNNINGSGSNGSRACRFARRIAVALANDPQGGVYQMKLPATSVFGKGTSDGMPFDQYVKYLASHGCSLRDVITQIGFDDHSDNPKLVFSAAKFLKEDAIPAFDALAESKEALNAVRFTVAQTDGVKKLASPRPSAAAPAVEEDDDVIVDEPIKRQAKKPTAEPAVPSEINDILNKFVKAGPIDDE